MKARTALVAAVASLATVVALDAAAQVTLPLIQARPDTGSRIRRPLASLTVPASEPYERLTREQKAAFLAQFKDLREGDEPAYPAEGLLPIAKSLAFALSDGAVAEGELFVTVHVDENGVAQSTQVFATPSSRVAREAATVLMGVKYKPARCAGKPCSSEFPFTARFGPG
jgi:hypothetical protein